MRDLIRDFFVTLVSLCFLLLSLVAATADFQMIDENMQDEHKDKQKRRKNALKVIFLAFLLFFWAVLSLVLFCLVITGALHLIGDIPHLY